MQLTKREQDAVDAYTAHGNQAKAANALGISRRSFRARFDGAKAKLLNTPLGFKTTKIATDAYGSITAMQHKLAPEIDNVKRTGIVTKRSTLYGADGSVTAEWVMTQPMQKQTNEYMEALEQNFITNVKPIAAPPVLKNDINEDDLVLFLGVDEHIGVHLCAEQVGIDYSLDDAVSLLEDRFHKIVARTPKTAQCLYVNLGDQFHANDHMDVTPGHKHPLNSSATFNTVSDAVVALNIRRVNLLLQHFDTVKLRGVAGNHDYDPAGWMFRCYDLAYKDEPRVSSKFWSEEVGAVKFGTNFLGFHHGHQMKPDALAGACADRNPKIYGDTRMRYLHTGHYHTDKTLDLWGGFQFNCHRTMSPKDYFSFKNGYLSRQTMKSYVYNRHEGEVAKFSTSLVPV